MAVAIVLGAIIGWQRERPYKAAGSTILVLGALRLAVLPSADGRPGRGPRAGGAANS